MTQLRWLDVYQTKVTNKGVQELRGALPNDAELVHLEEFAELERLYLDETQISGEGEWELRKAKPKLWISRRKIGAKPRTNPVSLESGNDALKSFKRICNACQHIDLTFTYFFFILSLAADDRPTSRHRVCG